MRRYRCKKCLRDQYSSSHTKENEPCMYCGEKALELMHDLVNGEQEPEVPNKDPTKNC